MSDVQTLIVRESSGAERTIPLDRETYVIGRAPACSIRIDSLYVSREHARIELRSEGLVLVDLGKMNASTVNGVRVENRSVVLNPGDVIGIADATIECLSEAMADGTTKALDKPVSQVIQPQSVSRLSPASVSQPRPDELRLDAQSYEVTIGETPLERRLSAQEFDLLRFLYEKQDRVCTSQELGDAIWGNGNWDKDMLHRLVHRLKRKLEPNPDKPRYVQTIPWIGYRVTP